MVLKSFLRREFMFIMPILARVFFCLTYHVHYILKQTGVALGVEVDDKLPYNEYFEYFGPDYNLHVTPMSMENQNHKTYLDSIRCSYFL